MFLKEDFEYIQRYNRDNSWENEDFAYHFSVKGKSADYLAQKYNLKNFSNLNVVIYKRYIYVTYKNNIDKSYVSSGHLSLVSNEDKEELIRLLNEDIFSDKRDLEEFKITNDIEMYKFQWAL